MLKQSTINQFVEALLWSQRSQDPGFGFVTFASFKQRENSLKANPHRIGEKILNVIRATERDNVEPRTKKTKASQKSKDENRLFVSRLLPSITESDLTSHFKQFGNLTECFIKRDVNGASKNFGFLRFETVFQYNICLKYKSHIICGKEITVEKVRVAEKEYTNKLFVRGVINDISKDDLKKLF